MENDAKNCVQCSFKIICEIFKAMIGVSFI